MRNHRILIVDDEESVLTVLRDSLQRMGTMYDIVTATDGLTALEYLRKDPFDLVVTDYKMAGMDGLELLESVRSIQPETRVVLMTAYGTDEVEAEARRLQAYQYLSKPLQINTFREIVKESLGQMAISRPGILILSDERYRQVLKVLKSLQDDVGARLIFLADCDGHVIAHVGNTDDLPLEQIASLLGGGIATLVESGRMIDDDKESINLAYREGAKDCLYAINVGEQLLLILVIRNSQYTSRIGSVWFYAQRSAATMRQTLGDAEFANPRQILEDPSEEDFQKDLESLFTPKQDSEQASEDDCPDEGFEEAQASDDSSVMTYDEAVAAGVIPNDPE